jgi:hypothetical protein
MRPPAILQNNWLRRVMLDLERPTPHIESFFIKANDPKHDRSLWLRLSLFSDGKETQGEALAVLFDKERGKPIAARERWPVSRILADPERPGVGIGPCAIEEGHAYGVVQGETHALSWELGLDDEAPEYRHLPSERLYRSDLVSNKLVSPHPSATLRGRLELWEGRHRHAECVRIDLNGWRAMQGHHWGKRNAESWAWSHCNLFNEAPTGAFFEGLSARTRLAGILQPHVSLGRLVIGEQVYRFDTWSSLGSRNRSEVSPLAWKFALSGPDGTLDGEVRAHGDDAVSITRPASAGPAPSVVSSRAELTLTLTPKHGPSRSLHSSKASLEMTPSGPVPEVALET